MAGIVDTIGPLPSIAAAAVKALFPTVYLKRGYDSNKTHDRVAILGLPPL